MVQLPNPHARALMDAMCASAEVNIKGAYQVVDRSPLVAWTLRVRGQTCQWLRGEARLSSDRTIAEYGAEIWKRSRARYRVNEAAVSSGALAEVTARRRDLA